MTTTDPQELLDRINDFDSATDPMPVTTLRLLLAECVPYVEAYAEEALAIELPAAGRE